MVWSRNIFQNRKDLSIIPFLSIRYHLLLLKSPEYRISKAINCESVFSRQFLKNDRKSRYIWLCKNPPTWLWGTFFFFIWVFFHAHSQFTGQQWSVCVCVWGGGINLTPLYHFQPLHRHLDIRRAMTAESSPLHIASSQTRTGNLWFPSTSR